MGILDYYRDLKYSFKFRHVFRSGVDFALIVLGVMITLIMMPFYFDRIDAEGANDPTVASTLSFVSTSDLASVTITPTSSGTFSASSGNNDIKFSISTNNFTGYTLSVRSNKTTLDNGGASLSSISSSLTSSQFSAAGNTQYNNKWGYKPNYYNSASNSRFYASPSTTATVLDQTTTANSTAKNYTISVGARVDTTVPSGSYVNDVFILEYVANAVPYSISFNKNTDGDIVNNMPNSISGEAVSASTVPLPIAVPTRVNYTFGGWCSVHPTEVAGGESCSGVTYNPGALYGMDYTINNMNVVLYAIWNSTHGCNKAATTIGTGVTATDAVCMQDINNTVILSMTSEAQYKLIDMRDDKEYFISKLADGKVWMTQNLNYNLDSTVTLTHDNTDLGYTTSETTKTWTPSADTLTDINNWTNSTTVAISYDHSAWYNHSSGSTNTDQSTMICNDAATCKHYNAGTFYNYEAAIAENMTSTSSYAVMPDSVCPAGWRLARGYTTSSYSEFNTLAVAYGVVDSYINSGSLSITVSALNTLRNAPIYMTRAGSVSGGTQLNGGVSARYYTSVLMTSTQAYMPAFNYNTLYPLNYTTFDTGASVRCVARMSGGTTTVNFYGNGAQSGTDKTITVESGMAVNLHQDGSFYKAGYKLTKWNTAADGSGVDYTLNGVVLFSPVTTTSVDLYAVWEPAYEIIYNGNNASTTAPMDVNHVVLNGESVQLYAPNYLRTGYGFAGWSTTQINPNDVDAATQMANAKIFGPNETITANYETLGQNVPTVITLYAVWVKSSGSIQDWKGCGEMTATTRSGETFTPGSIIALTDTRDNNTYAIAKLNDGNCWMIENLRLSTTGSNNAAKALGFGGVFSGLANSEDNFTNTNTTANSKYSTSNITGNNQSYRIPRFNYNNTMYGGANSNNVLMESSPTTNNDHAQWYGYGNYYNWPAAMANTDEITDSVVSKALYTSICPSGWLLPSTAIYTEDYSFRKLFYYLFGNYSTTSFSASTNPTGAVASNRMRTYPNNFVYSGYYTNTAPLYRGTRGYYWTNNGTSAIDASMPFFYSTQVTTLSGTNRTNGLSIRCVADKNYRLLYNGNGADSGFDMTIRQPAVAGSTLTLFAPNYKRDGYGFIGWSFTQINPDSANIQTTIANTTIYGPNETITLPSTITSDLILYAVWLPSAGNLQNWSGCGSLSQGSVTALTDTRDSQVYAVAKLEDGNCWMIENLRLDDAHSTDSSKSQGFGGVFVGLSSSTTVFTENVIDTSLYTINPRSTTLNIISGDHQSKRFPRYNSDNTKNTVSHFSNDTGQQNVYSYGNYYNWPAAMANTSIMSSNALSETAGTSLCPAGWRLPTAAYMSATTPKEMTNVINIINEGSTSSSAKLREYPNNFVLAGYFTSSGVSSRGSTGYLLSSSVPTDSTSYGLYFYKSGTTSIGGPNRTEGRSVRCIRDTRVEVILDSNDGTGRYERVYGDSGSTITLPIATAFMNDDSVVTSWNTQSNGGGASYTTSYTGSSITLYAQWTSSYKIIYDGNNETSATTMDMYGHTGIANNARVVLYENNVLRDGYGFAGWSTTQIDPDAANAASQVANAKIFGPNEVVTANSTTLGVPAPATVTLYAVWIKSSGYLQTWDGCDGLTQATYSNGLITPGDVIALTDNRDNQTYAVAKLTNGQCWMIEPLRLDVATANINTNNTNYPTADFLSMRTTSYDWCETQSAACIDRVKSTSIGNPIVSGIFYNWFTGTAGNGTYSMSSSNALGDICPSGWHIPITTYLNSSNDFASLAVSVGGQYTYAYNSEAAALSEKLRTYPNNLRYLGYTSSQSPYTSVELHLYRFNAYYMGASASSSSVGAYNAYSFSDSSIVLINENKYRGTTIACVKNPKAVRYDGNGADAGQTMKVTHTATPSSSINLYASNYKRDGYGFLGWSFTQIDPDAANAATQIANATIYGPNETITLPSTINSDVVLYAVWIKSAGNMQSWSGCSSMSSGNVTALKDTRDNQVYAIAKLADGNCWMIENMRLSDTNSYDSSKAQGYGGVFSGLASSETATFTYSTVANSLYSVGLNSSGANKIVGDYTDYRLPRYNNANTANVVSVMTTNSENIYSYGHYFNFAAANANTGTLLPAGASDYSGTSVCPLGWRLPTGGAGKEYANLNTAVNSGSTSNTVGYRTYPNNFILSGYAWSGSIVGRGIYGDWWSSTSTSATGAYDMEIGASSASVNRDVNRGFGSTVRCISASSQLTVTLNSNDAYDQSVHIYGASGDSITLSTETFVRNNSKIVSWNTQPNGSGTSYTSSYTISGNITLYAQWASAYNITYNGNGASNPTGMDISSHSSVGNGDEIMLFANNFSRNGYGFLGWSISQIDPDAPNASTLIANAKIFGPNETITASSATLGQSVPANITLYAVWLKASGTFQNWNGCSSMTATVYNNGTITPGSVVALTDTRGSTNNTYAVAKLSDGECWMIEEARFDVKNDNIGNGASNFPTATFLTQRTGSVATCTTNSQSCAESLYYSTGNGQSNGTYYNWYTVTGGNGTYQGNYGGVNGDICPAGWHIPVGGTGYDYGDLIVSVGGGRNNYDATTTPTGESLSRTVRTYPYNFVYGGTTSGINYYDYRVTGYYSTSTGWNNGTARYQYFFGISDTYTRLSYGTTKVTGMKTRCIYGPAIIYDGNGATSGEGNGFTRISGSTVQLATQNFERTGYGFLGWSLTSNGSTTIYGPNETVNVSELTANQDAVGNIRLYAIWVQVSGNMQNWNGCNSLTIPSAGVATSGLSNVTALTDTRDNRVYTVARFADGNCYMVNDLRLGETNLSTDLTSSNSNVTNTVTASTFNGWTTTAYTSSYTNPVVTPLKTEYNKPGVIYNVCAASAGTICTDSNSSYATEDICPAGWRLPTGTTTGDYYSLYSNYGYNTSAIARKSAVNGGLSLMLSSTTATYNSSSYYPTSANMSTTAMYTTYLTPSYYSAASSLSRNASSALRCVMNKPMTQIRVYYGTGVSSVTVNGVTVANYSYINLEQGTTVPIVMYLQPDYSFSSWSISSGSGTIGVSAQTSTLTVGSTTGNLYSYATFSGTYIQNLASSQCTTTARTVYDSRDMTKYTVKRLSDGRCWMMNNLELGRTSISSNLTSSNTNISSTIAASTFNSWIKTSGTSSSSTGELINVSGTDSTSGNNYGTLYNYYAATAGTGTGDFGEAPYDLCPAGWRLPTGNTTGEYATLYSYYNSFASLRNSVANGGVALPLSGVFAGSTPSGQGTYGIYWTSTFAGTSAAWIFRLAAPSTVQTDLYLNRTNGYAVRCILDSGKRVSQLTYLQDFNTLSSTDKTSVINSMRANTTYPLLDNRDSQTYRIAKLADNRVYIVDNMNLGDPAYSITAPSLNKSNTNINNNSLYLVGSFEGYYSAANHNGFDAAYVTDGNTQDTTSLTYKGVNYNYCAATMYEICTNSNSATATMDICPAGWRLPTGGSSGEFQTLYNAYGSYTNMRASVPAGGAGISYLAENSTTYRLGMTGGSAAYWASGPVWDSVGQSAMIVSNTSNYVSIADYRDRNRGASVRCILKQ